VRVAKPEISIVLPTYNRSALLSSVIHSITSQLHADFEVVVVDDGSTDNTEEMVAALQSQDPRLRYIKLLQNCGIGFARQAGIQASLATKYIAQADSDDLWIPGRLECQVSILEEHPEIDILFGNYLNIDPVQGIQGTGFALSKAGFDLMSSRQLGEDLFLVEGGLDVGVLVVNFVAPPTTLIRKETFSKIGGFDVRLRAAEDVEFFFRAAVKGITFAYLDSPLIERRVTSDRSTTGNDRYNLHRLQALDICWQTCLEAGRNDLLGPIRQAKLKSFRRLIASYGAQSRRREACRVFSDSLKVSFSPRTALLFLASLLGPRGVAALRTTRMRVVRIGT